MRWTYRIFFICLILCCANLAVAVNVEGVDGGKTYLYYFSLTPALITNLQDHGSYIRCDIDLMAEDKMGQADIERYAPVIRHELLLLLADQHSSALDTPEGREALRLKALQKAAAVILLQTGKNSVHDLYFTGLYVNQ